jgi:imidazole glycerol phosphate synthase subunit HisF
MVLGLIQWDHVFLGHYHGAQKLSSTVEYVGSPLQLSRGERDQEKHIIEFDVETGAKEYIVNTFSPKHIRISIDKLSTMSQEDFTHHEIDIITDDVSSSKVVEARQQLEDAGAGGVRFVCIEKDITDQIKDIDQAKAILNTGSNMIEEYVKIANVAKDDSVSKLDNSRLTKIGNEIISRSVMV